MTSIAELPDVVFSTPSDVIRDVRAARGAQKRRQEMGFARRREVLDSWRSDRAANGVMVLGRRKVPTPALASNLLRASEAKR